MNYIRNTTELHITEPTVLTLGKFDGLHMGHKRLVEEMQEKQREGLATVMFTFDVPPKSITKGDPAMVLTTNQEKEYVFGLTGLDYLIEYPFTQEVRQMEPEEFVTMLVEQLQVKCIVAGADFGFGRNRSGNYKTLECLGEKYSFETVIVPKRLYQDREISSSYIREELQQGNLSTANMLLGYEYFLQGIVTYGKQLGRKLNIPTVNLLPPPEKLLPPFGVYVSRVRMGDRLFGGISNVGRKPTIEGENPVGVETHIFDFSDDVYGKEIQVEFLEFLRSEQKFESVEALKEQMTRDIQVGREYLQKYKRRTL